MLQGLILGFILCIATVVYGGDRDVQRPMVYVAPFNFKNYQTAKIKKPIITYFSVPDDALPDLALGNLDYLGKMAVRLMKVKNFKCRGGFKKPEQCAKQFLKEVEIVKSNNDNFLTRMRYLLRSRQASPTLIPFYEQTYQRSFDIDVELQQVAFQLLRKRRFITYQTRRQLELLGISFLATDVKTRRYLTQLKHTMIRKLYSIPMCDEFMYHDLTINSTIVQLERYRRNEEYWRKCHDQADVLMRQNYLELNKILNEVAQDNGYDHYVQAQRFMHVRYHELEHTLSHLYRVILPMYRELHAYARRKILEIYPSAFPEDGPIPEHLLQHGSWENLKELLRPFPDVHAKWERHLWQLKGASGEPVMNYINKMINIVGNIGYDEIPASVFILSKLKVVEKGQTCPPMSFYDFSNTFDYAALGCITEDMDGMKKLHYIFMKILYMLQFKDQPYLYRKPATPAMYEGMARMFSYLPNVYNYTYRMGLYDEMTKIDIEKYEMNYLMDEYVDALTFIPYAYATEEWRQQVFNGSFDRKNYNKQWWHLRWKLEGITPPTERDLYQIDALAHANVAINKPLYNDILSTYLSFGFLEAFCDMVPKRPPLHKCDFTQYGLPDEYLRKTQVPGRGIPWRLLLEQATRHRYVSAEGLRKYFKPLYRWMRAENAKNNAKVGWTPPHNYPFLYGDTYAKDLKDSASNYNDADNTAGDDEY